MQIFARVLLIGVLGLLTTLLGCANEAGQYKRGTTEKEVYEMAQSSLNTKNWENAIKALELLEENFPFGTFGEQGQLELTYAHFRAQNFEESIATADRFIRLHPQHRNVDYAYYIRGLASFNREKTFFSSLFGSDHTNRDPGAARESFDHFTQFIQRFPESPYAPDAQKRMVYLRNILARTEIHVANYYFKRGAFLAAANRGAFVVENFQGTPAVPDALAVMAQAYYLLDMAPLADDAVKILAANYTKHPALNALGTFDNKYIYNEESRSWVSYLTFGLFDRTETRGFDTRELYNPEYQVIEAPSAQ